MKNNSNELPQFSIKFAHTVFVLGFLFSFFVVIFYVYRFINPFDDPYPNYTRESLSKYFLMMICFGVIFATLFGLGLRLSNHLKVNLSVLFVTAGIAIYGFETYLEFFQEKQSPNARMSEQMGVLYDRRTKLEVLEDLIDSGIKAYPNTFPSGLRNSNGLTTNEGRIYPLGTISNYTIVYNNESGYWVIYDSDEHGFNNPKGLYETGKVDIVLTGDSYTEGSGIKPNNSISAVLLKSGFNAISVGKGGNGALIELAALKEYAEPLKPKIVLWVYWVNDLMDLKNEMQSSLLRKYLNEDDFSQNLISRQEEIDSVLINYVQREWERQRQLERELRTKRENHWRTRIPKLYNLRLRINLIPTPIRIPTPTPTPTPIFKDILHKSKQMVSGWRGKMYLVYLPSFTRYSTGNEHPCRKFVMRTATELDIPIIDIQRNVFDSHPDPLSLFPFRSNGHYNVEGYRLVAEAIGKRLKADGVVPINSNN